MLAWPRGARSAHHPEGVLPLDLVLGSGSPTSLPVPHPNAIQGPVSYCAAFLWYWLPPASGPLNMVPPAWKWFLSQVPFQSTRTLSLQAGRPQIALRAGLPYWSTLGHMSASCHLGPEVPLWPGGRTLLPEDTLPKHPGEPGEDIRAAASGSGWAAEIKPWEL